MSTKKTTNETLQSAYTAFDFEDSLVLSDGKTMLIILSPEGKRVWTGIQEGKKEEEIAREMADEMGAPLSETEPFVRSLISSLVSHASLSIAPEPPPQTQASPGSPHTSESYEIFGKKILIRYGDENAQKALAPLLRHTQTENTSTPNTADLTCDLFPDGESNYAFTLNGETKICENALPYVKGVALFELFSALYPEKQWLSVIHGAVVRRGECAIPLVGGSGSGKSTLAAALTKDGFDLMSDDLVILEKGGLGLMETPYALALKEGSWEVLIPFIPDMDYLPEVTLYGETLRFHAPFTRTHPTPPPPVPAKAIFFVQYDKDTSRDLTELTSVEALSKLIKIGAWVSHRENDLEDFLAWLSATPAFDLRYSDLAEARNAILKIVL